MVGFGNARITRPGYAIEYDFFDPRDLGIRSDGFIAGLFFASQINGTHRLRGGGRPGPAGRTATALQVQEKDSWSPRRDEAYLGVLVDDLITRGTQGLSDVHLARRVPPDAARGQCGLRLTATSPDAGCKSATASGRSSSASARRSTGSSSAAARHLGASHGPRRTTGLRPYR